MSKIDFRDVTHNLPHLLVAAFEIESVEWKSERQAEGT